MRARIGYEIPVLKSSSLGGGKVEMIGTLINRQFGVARDWPFGSAISLVLMLLVLVGVILYFRSGGEERRAM